MQKNKIIDTWSIIVLKKINSNFTKFILIKLNKCNKPIKETDEINALFYYLKKEIDQNNNNNFIKILLNSENFIFVYCHTK